MERNDNKNDNKNKRKKLAVALTILLGIILLVFGGKLAYDKFSSDTTDVGKVADNHSAIDEDKSGSDRDADGEVDSDPGIESNSTAVNAGNAVKQISSNKAEESTSSTSRSTAESQGTQTGGDGGGDQEGQGTQTGGAGDDDQGSQGSQTGKDGQESQGTQTGGDGGGDQEGQGTQTGGDGGGDQESQGTQTGGAGDDDQESQGTQTGDDDKDGQESQGSQTGGDGGGDQEGQGSQAGGDGGGDQESQGTQAGGDGGGDQEGQGTQAGGDGGGNQESQGTQTGGAGDDDGDDEEITATYLSDIPYVTDQTKIGWGTIAMDQTSNGSALSLIVDGGTVTFKKGIFAHATSTVVYDLSEYDCDYFSTYYGISSLQGQKGDVKFYIYTSADGANWNLVTSENPTALTAGSEAVYAKIPISGVKYLKLYADQNGGNGNDHAIYCDAKIYKEGYKENLLPTVAEYDKKIKTAYEAGYDAGYDAGNGTISDELELLLLQRELVKNAGQYTLKTFAEESEANKNVLDMLMGDSELLKLYLVGGKPEGSYLKSLEVLSKLYSAHGTDLSIDTQTQYGTRLGDLYRTMMLAISLTHSGNVYLWVDGSATSDPVKRYEIYKELHSDGLIEVETFESLTVEEMRWVMNTVIDDEEIKWLNNYVRIVKNGATGPYSYITYTFDYNYTLDKYYSAENYAQWDAKYGLSECGVSYESGHPKLWIVFEEGAVCGGLSKTGSCIWGSYKGLPNTCVSQPAHCAYIYYTKVGDNGVWGLGNNVSGWGKSGRTEHLAVRIMNDWGNSASGWTASYILLAQAAQNEYDKYEKSEITLMLADVYKDDTAKKEALYRKALGEEIINFDAWTGLVDLYLSDSNKTEEQYYELAEEIASALTFYPRPMYDLLSKLEANVTSSAIQASFTMLKTRTLTTASNATDAQTIQRSAVVEVAKQLLGTTDGTIATFSFDGENGGKIVLGSRFEGSDVAWDYSIDGGTNWVQCTESTHALTQTELDAITADKDIKVHIIGVDYSDANIYTIDIKESQGIPSTVYANDLEDRIIAVSDTMQWRFSEGDSWTYFKDAQPDLSGDKTVMVRVSATGEYLASDSATYSFTTDTLPATKKYISIDKLSIAGFSSETNPNTDYYKRDWRATYAIDGNINTLWHTDPRNPTDERYITIKIDEPLYISALDYLPSSANSGVGVIKNADIYVSSDGESWTKVASFTNSPKTYTVKQLTFEPVLAQYVKLNVTAGYYSNDVFANAGMINLYYDSTKSV